MFFLGPWNKPGLGKCCVAWYTSGIYVHSSKTLRFQSLQKIKCTLEGWRKLTAHLSSSHSFPLRSHLPPGWQGGEKPMGTVSSLSLPHSPWQVLWRDTAPNKRLKEYQARSLWLGQDFEARISHCTNVALEWSIQISPRSGSPEGRAKLSWAAGLSAPFLQNLCHLPLPQWGQVQQILGPK